MGDPEPVDEPDGSCYVCRLARWGACACVVLLACIWLAKWIGERL